MMGPPSRASVTRSSLRLRFSCAARFAEGCSTRGVHASPSPSRTRVASLWALPKAVPVAVAVAVKVAVAVAARDGGGAMRSAKPASVGRTRSGCWKGPITTESGARGTGAEGSVTAARATSSTALARRIAGVGATILRKGGEGWEGTGVSARRVGDGRASHQGVDSEGPGGETGSGGRGDEPGRSTFALDHSNRSYVTRAEKAGERVGARGGVPDRRGPRAPGFRARNLRRLGSESRCGCEPRRSRTKGCLSSKPRANPRGCDA